MDKKKHYSKFGINTKKTVMPKTKDWPLTDGLQDITKNNSVAYRKK